jgi:two-component system, NarL family, invasion response regulator UvrY
MKVLLVDDHPVVIQGIRLILSQMSEIAEIGEAYNGSQALAKINGEAWDVVVLDINLPDVSGFDLLKQIKRSRPQLPVVMLTLHAEEQFATRTLKAGASGYLTKEAAPDELIRALTKVRDGGKYISPELAHKVALSWERGQKKQGLHERLSDREFQILRMIAGGYTASEIAEKLLLSVKTVSTYRSRVLEKLGLGSNAEIIRYAIEHHLVE